MTRKKPLPYYANQKLDDIRIDASSLIKVLRPLLEHGDLDVVQRASVGIQKSYDIIISTDMVKNISRDGKKAKEEN